MSIAEIEEETQVGGNERDGMIEVDLWPRLNLSIWDSLLQ